MFGLGKRRTKLGKWLDARGYNQEDLVKASKVSRNTISRACNELDYTPSISVIKKIIKALREVDPSVRADRFWDL
ncbi:hypothetical protein J31TS4_18990 [Paenibacillus sp. J31TS4]|uniref:helix-turn-helix transcriptional regulator n=1 Tax=Paenibacillus sp. J31TS4 TaxID=2807195 RepID=UPI001AFEFFF4|nr:helix-turn-helix transcriptional regulator [Paenibacillus sp. J31TS4]GIP38619.1 hypothetical protein J31TS4_18990 [Paenibacillus sp. J31TS4]